MELKCLFLKKRLQQKGEKKLISVPMVNKKGSSKVKLKKE